MTEECREALSAKWSKKQQSLRALRANFQAIACVSEELRRR